MAPSCFLVSAFLKSSLSFAGPFRFFLQSGSVQVPFYKPRFVSGINSLALNPNAVFSPMTGKVEKVSFMNLLFADYVVLFALFFLYNFFMGILDEDTSLLPSTCI